MLNRYYSHKPTLVEKTMSMPASAFEAWMDRFYNFKLRKSSTVDWELEDASTYNIEEERKEEKALLTYTVCPNVHALPITYQCLISLT